MLVLVASLVGTATTQAPGEVTEKLIEFKGYQKHLSSDKRLVLAIATISTLVSGVCCIFGIIYMIIYGGKRLDELPKRNDPADSGPQEIVEEENEPPQDL
ncbi:hypothetical protein SprV_0301232100 [Sparganum proliferum]